MNLLNFIIFLCGFFILCLMCVFSLKNKNPITDIINNSSKVTRFTPTYFEIYDKSTENNCTRLIIIYPFRWFIFSNENNVYLLDSESGYTCPVNMTPAVEIRPTNNLEVVCTSMDRDTILKYFENVKPIRIDYNLIGVEKFTITDALNKLFDGYLTLKDDLDNTTLKNDHLPGILKFIPLYINRKRTKRDIYSFSSSKNFSKVYSNTPQRRKYYLTNEEREHLTKVINKYYKRQKVVV